MPPSKADPSNKVYGGARTIQTLLQVPSSEPFQHFGSELARPGCLSSHIVRSSTRQLSLAELLRLICNDRMHPSLSNDAVIHTAGQASVIQCSFVCGLTSLHTRHAVGRHTHGLEELSSKPGPCFSSSQADSGEHIATPDSRPLVTAAAGTLCMYVICPPQWSARTYLQRLAWSHGRDPTRII